MKMGPQEEICRLCLKICDKFKAIEEYIKDALDILLPKMDFAAMQKPVVCTNCEKMLIKCYDFKAACFCTRDYIIPLVNNNDTVKLNLKDVYQSKNENEAGFPEDHDICGFCMNPVKKCSAISVDVEKGDVILKNMIGKCLPELDLCIIEKPVICVPCYDSLENCFHFITNCLIVEEKVKKYRETLDQNSKSLIELGGILQFTPRDIYIKSSDGSLIGAIKAEKQLCEEIENVGKSETGKGDGAFKLEQMFCENDESAKKEVKLVSYMHMDDLIFNNVEQFTPEDVLACNFDVIKTGETFCGEKEPKEENVAEMEEEFLLNEGIEIKTEVLDFNSVQDSGTLPQEDTHNYNLRKRQKCSVVQLSEDSSQVSLVKSGRKYTNEPGRGALRQGNTSENMYRCASCSFQTKCKRIINNHNLIHKNPSEIEMGQCKLCSFKTKYKGSLKRHMFLHGKSLERTLYRCDFCSYQVTDNKCLIRHMLTHSNPPEVKMYKCASCSFHTKYKESLYAHVRIHKDLSEVTIHHCDVCSFKTKYKKHIKRHLLTHKDPSEITMHHCDICSYSTKRNYNLKQHLLIHKTRDNNEITMYQCASCSFQTKLKSSLVRHLSIHKNPSKTTMYKCDLCSYQTRQKSYLKSHLLIHKKPSEVKIYHCASCSFQTKNRRSLVRHLLIHKNPS